VKIGTRSVLFGAHCWLLHPWFVFAAWRKLYGFPWDPRLWVAFFVHDLGYIGKPNMDGPEGERHVEFGAWLMRRLFDRGYDKVDRCAVSYAEAEILLAQDDHWRLDTEHEDRNPFGGLWSVVYICRLQRRATWYEFCLYHSRFYAKKDNKPFSRLCVADKLSIVLTPAWLYLPMVRWSGEIDEYMSLARDGGQGEKYASTGIPIHSELRWYQGVQEYLRRWVDEHKDGREDTWTPNAKE
jgi:hypothetical protein